MGTLTPHLISFHLTTEQRHKIELCFWPVSIYASCYPFETANRACGGRFLFASVHLQQLIIVGFAITSAVSLANEQSTLTPFIASAKSKELLGKGGSPWLPLFPKRFVENALSL